MLNDREIESALAELGAHLVERLDELVERANARISAELPSYHALVPAEDLAESGRNVIGMVLKQLDGTELGSSDDSVEVALERGRRRQSQGVALEDVLRAVRLDFAVLWEPIVSRAMSTDQPPDVVSRAMLRIWESLDGVMLAITEGYRYQENLVDRELLSRRTRVLANLVYEPNDDPGAIAHAAEVLGLDPEADFLVTAARLGEGQESRLEMRWRSLGSSAHVVLVGDHAVGLTTWTRHNNRVLVEMVKGHSDRQAVLAPPIHGLAGVHAGVSLARSVLPAAPPGAVIEARDLLIEALVATQTGIAIPLSKVLLAGLAELPRTERQRLLETLDGWLEVDGTTADVARHLHRHRNTVINHLRRVEEVTGLSMSKPVEAATLVTALIAGRSWLATD